uniref:All-trans-retinol 13,14-reductase n=1 Tax=Opuntia streptacantha TaxID=393608 RepID=A0A7C9CI92_OPUST
MAFGALPSLLKFHTLPSSIINPNSNPKSHLKSDRPSILARSSNGRNPSSDNNGVPSPLQPQIPTSFPGKAEADVVVIGSGIGGLCCAGLLARYEEDVLVLESHDQPGGAAHAFEVKGYKFDSGPSLFSGFQSRGPQANPLAQVLDALGETVPCAKYDSWMVYVPEGDFLSKIGPTEFFKDLEKYAGPNAAQEWRKLLVGVTVSLSILLIVFLIYCSTLSPKHWAVPVRECCISNKSVGGGLWHFYKLCVFLFYMEDQMASCWSVK